MCIQNTSKVTLFKYINTIQLVDLLFHDIKLLNHLLCIPMPSGLLVIPVLHPALRALVHLWPTHCTDQMILRTAENWN